MHEYELTVNGLIADSTCSGSRSGETGLIMKDGDGDCDTSVGNPDGRWGEVCYVGSEFTQCQAGEMSQKRREQQFTVTRIL